MEFDYKKILIAYLNHLLFKEGNAFLGKSADKGIPGLTQEDIAELRRLHQSIYSKL